MDPPYQVCQPSHPHFRSGLFLGAIIQLSSAWLSSWDHPYQWLVPFGYLFWRRVLEHANLFSSTSLAVNTFEFDKYHKIIEVILDHLYSNKLMYYKIHAASVGYSWSLHRLTVDIALLLIIIEVVHLEHFMVLIRIYVFRDRIIYS